MKTRRCIMETAKLTDFLSQFLFIHVKTRNISKALNLIESLNKSSQCLEELYYFFIMPDVEKRRAIAGTCCLNNLYGCYASLQAFLNFLLIKNNKKETTSFSRLSHQIS